MASIPVQQQWPPWWWNASTSAFSVIDATEAPPRLSKLKMGLKRKKRPKRITKFNMNTTILNKDAPLFLGCYRFPEPNDRGLWICRHCGRCRRHRWSSLLLFPKEIEHFLSVFVVCRPDVKKMGRRGRELLALPLRGTGSCCESAAGHGTGSKKRRWALVNETTVLSSTESLRWERKSPELQQAEKS